MTPLKPDERLRCNIYEDLAEQWRMADPFAFWQSPKVYARLLHELEHFVQDVISGEWPVTSPEIDRPHRWGVSRNDLASKYFRSVSRYAEIPPILSPAYEYSEYANVFGSCCKKLGWPVPDTQWAWSSIVDPVSSTTAGEMFIRLVTEIRREFQSSKVSTKLRNRKRNAKTRYLKGCSYVDRLFANRARLIVLRLDLGYKENQVTQRLYEPIEAQKAQLQDEAQTAVKDFDHLLTNQRNNAIFEGLKGYIAKLEYGIQAGVHWHLLLFFDGSIRNPSSHSFLAQSIGEYWVENITKGVGSYWNCNANTDKYERFGTLGIGLIESHQSCLRDNLKRHVLKYFYKTTQYLRPKFGPKIRLIRKGVAPQPSARGRPRKSRPLA